MPTTEAPPRIAVIVPCYNEELTVGAVVEDFRAALPQAEIYVFDNVSTDRTAEVARAAGARVIHSPRKGKGNVVRHMADAVEADIYILVDGDGTYPAADAPALVRDFQARNLDMLVATRLREHAAGSFRIFHRLGNHLVSRLVSVLFSAPVTDILSGYRVLSRNLVKIVRLRSPGFEVETELTLQSLAKHFAVGEKPVAYGTRPAGSHSKLSTLGDGYVILKCLFLIFKDYKPLLFFAGTALAFTIASLVAGIGPIREYLEMGLVFQVPRAILAAGLGILAALSLAVGLVLDTIARYHGENVELWKQQIRTLDEALGQRRRPPPE